MSDALTDQDLNSPMAGRNLLMRLGPYVVALALALALATFLIFAGFTPVLPTNCVVLTLFASDALVILVLVVLVAHEAWKLRRARLARSSIEQDLARSSAEDLRGKKFRWKKYNSALKNVAIRQQRCINATRARRPRIGTRIPPDCLNERRAD